MKKGLSNATNSPDFKVLDNAAKRTRWPKKENMSDRAGSSGCSTPSGSTPDPTQPDPSAALSSSLNQAAMDEYEVERIIGSVILNSGKEVLYHVLWKDWTMFQTTLEKRSHLDNCLDELNKFEVRRNGLQRIREKLKMTCAVDYPGCDFNEVYRQFELPLPADLPKEFGKMSEDDIQKELAIWVKKGEEENNKKNEKEIKKRCLRRENTDFIKKIGYCTLKLVERHWASEMVEAGEGDILLESSNEESWRSIASYQYTNELVWSPLAESMRKRKAKNKCKCGSVCRSCVGRDFLLFNLKSSGLLDCADRAKISQGLNDLYKDNVIMDCPASCPQTSTCLCSIQKTGRQVPVCVFFKLKYGGYELRALTDIVAGTFITHFAGKVMTAKEADGQGSHTYAMPSGLVISCKEMGNLSRFPSHSCQDSNVVYIWTTRPGEYRTANHKLLFFATRDIEAGDELTVNYKMDQSLAKEHNSVSCSCRKNCGNRVFV